MLNKEGKTYEVLEQIGVDYVRFAKIKINDRNRKRKSKITGKMRKGRIDSSGKMRKSLNYEIDETDGGLGVFVTGIDYTEDVDQGNKRKTSKQSIERWMKTKRIRLTNEKGFIKMTPAVIANFANFVAWKVSTIGSDYTGFLEEAQNEAFRKYENELLDAIVFDTAQSIESVLSQLKALDIDFKFE